MRKAAPTIQVPGSSMTHQYTCPAGHYIASPHEQTACPAGTCGKPVTPINQRGNTRSPKKGSSK